MRSRTRLGRVLRFALLGAFALAAAIVGGSCSTTPTVLPSRDFNRPTDVVFACVGAFTDVVGRTDCGGADQPPCFSGRPIDWCQPGGATPAVADAQHHTFAFIPNSDSGELSVVDADLGKLVDLDPSVSGYSRLPLGVLPEQIAVSDDGCRLVTANRGSCDLTVVNPALLVAPTIKTGTTQAAAADIALTIPPVTSTGRLQAAPQEIRFLPQDTAALNGSSYLCQGDTTYGVQPQPGPDSTPAPTTWKALVTFPTCDLVATIDLPSGQIIDSAYVRLASDKRSLILVPAGADPHCSADCGTVDRARVDADGGAGGTGDGGATDAGAATTPDGSTIAGAPPTGTTNPPYLGPSGIDIVPPAATGYGIHAFVSLANASQIVSLDVSPDGLITAPAAGAFIPLDATMGSAVGSDRIRLSVNPNLRAPGGKTMGRFVDDSAHPERQYLYVIARDGSLRVVEVAKQPETECETNIDPQNPPPGYDPQAACTPVTADSYKYRRPFAVGPGIRFGSIPIDVAVADTRYDTPIPGDYTFPTGQAPSATVRELSLSGVFAWVATSSGTVFLLNIDPVPRTVWYINQGASVSTSLGTTGSTTVCNDSTPCLVETLPPVNTLRNGNVETFSRALSPSFGPARLDLPPLIPSSGPRIATLWTDGTLNNATAITGLSNMITDNTTNPPTTTTVQGYIPTYVYFPDEAAVTPQSWSASWQGPLFGGPRFTGTVAASTLADPGISYCQVGAQVGDLLTLTGCVDNNQCGVGRVCIHGAGSTEAAGGLSIGGICVAPASQAALTNTCLNELSTIRRYTVTTLTDHVLTLEPHLDELAFSNLGSCSDSRRPPGAVGTPDAGAADAGAADAGATADGGAAGAANCSDPNDTTTADFRCTDLTSAGIAGVTGTRCVQACSTPGSTDECRTGRICVAYGGVGDCTHKNCFCADAPQLNNPQCGYDQLTPYQVNAGRAFVVSGSVTALPTARSVVNGQCGDPIQPHNPRSVARISMDAGPMTLCTDPNAASLGDTRCDAAGSLASCTEAQRLFQLVKTMPSPNPCLFTSGANETDPAGDTGHHVNALFRNTEVAFVITNLEWAPTIPQDLRFDVHGGFRADAVVIPPTVEVSMPGRIVVGPQLTSTPTVLNVPYLFVVDQRALGRTAAGGPTRGQLLRIHPVGQADSTGAYQPWFEDFTHSNNEYPIR